MGFELSILNTIQKPEIFHVRENFFNFVITHKKTGKILYKITAFFFIDRLFLFKQGGKLVYAFFFTVLL